jgi:NAD(P)-dependent dehydrogenase (short-subunit alcohol dehydrogenase family)
VKAFPDRLDFIAAVHAKAQPAAGDLDQFHLRGDRHADRCRGEGDQRSRGPSPEYICGATANAGLAAFTKALGKGSIEHGVRVVGVHPPSTRTDRILQVMKAAAKAKLGDENRYEELVGKGGMFGQMIEPEQVADAVAFLASRRAGQLSGIVLNLGT